MVIKNAWDSRGQSLLELTIALGATAAIVAALAIITVKALQGSQFAQNQTVATQLAQQAIEQLRAIKSQNGFVCTSSGQDTWNNTIWGPSCASPGCVYIVKPANSSCSGIINPNPFLDSNGVPEEVGIFTRIITIEATGNDNEKKATALVTWTDGQGAHQSTLVTYLANI